jgi:hypothetical protein
MYMECIKLYYVLTISYKGFSQHNNKTTIVFIVLQRHASTHTSHLQARTILFYKVTMPILGSQTVTCLLHRCYLLYYKFIRKHCV